MEAEANKRLRDFWASCFSIIAVRGCDQRRGNEQNVKKQTRSEKQFSFGFYLMSLICKRRCWGRVSFYFLFLHLNMRKQTNSISFALWGCGREVHIHIYIFCMSSHLQWLVDCRTCLPTCGAVEPEAWTELKTAGQREMERESLEQTWMNGTEFHAQTGIHMFSNSYLWAQKRQKHCVLQVDRLYFIQLVKSCDNSLNSLSFFF